MNKYSTWKLVWNHENKIWVVYNNQDNIVFIKKYWWFKNNAKRRVIKSLIRMVIDYFENPDIAKIKTQKEQTERGYIFKIILTDKTYLEYNYITIVIDITE